MTIVNPSELIEARENLGISQSKLSRETGVNRAYISQFENGKRVLEDHCLDKIAEHLESLGWVSPNSEDVEILPDSTRLIPVAKLKVLDGFVIPEGIPLGEELEFMIDEFDRNTDRIEELKQKELRRGLLGGLDPDSANEQSLEVLVLSARNLEIISQIHGKYEATYQGATLEDDDSLTKIGHYVEALIYKFMG